VRPGEGAIGGGSTPDQTLPTYVVEIKTASAAKLERALRRNKPPVLARIEKGNVLLDCRTIDEPEIEIAAAAIRAALNAAGDRS